MRRLTISMCGSIAWVCWLAVMASREAMLKGIEFRVAVVPAARYDAIDTSVASFMPWVGSEPMWQPHAQVDIELARRCRVVNLAQCLMGERRGRRRAWPRAIRSNEYTMARAANRQVTITVVHEIAHHFGISDARLHELGYG